MDKRLHPLLLQERQLQNQKYKGMTFTTIAAKVYNALLLSHI